MEVETVEGALSGRHPVTIDGETVYVGTAEELAVALDVLQGRHDREVLRQLAPHLETVMKGPVGPIGTLRSLSPDDQKFLIEAVGPGLPRLVRNAGRLRDLLAVLAEPAVEEQFLAALGSTGLRDLIVTAADLSEVLEWVYGHADQMVLDLLGTEHLRRLFTSGLKLGQVLSSLDEEVQVRLIERIGWGRVAELVTDGRDLAYLQRALPSRLSGRLLGQYSRDQLVALIGNGRDWEFLWRRLETAEQEQLCALLGVECDAK